MAPKRATSGGENFLRVFTLTLRHRGAHSGKKLTPRHATFLSQARQCANSGECKFLRFFTLFYATLAIRESKLLCPGPWGRKDDGGRGGGEGFLCPGPFWNGPRISVPCAARAREAAARICTLPPNLHTGIFKMACRYAAHCCLMLCLVICIHVYVMFLKSVYAYYKVMLLRSM